MSMKIVVDNSKCSGCKICELFCALGNSGECNPKKAFIKITGHFPVPGGYQIKMKKGCTLCGECVKWCPTGALCEKSDPAAQKGEPCFAGEAGLGREEAK